MNVVTMNESQFFHQVTDSTEPVLVEFMAPWCVYCRRIGPAFDRLAKEYEGRVSFSKINIDDVPGLTDQEQIEIVPTLVLYRQGKALGSIVAPDSKDKIEALIREYLLQCSQSLMVL